MKTADHSGINFPFYMCFWRRQGSCGSVIVNLRLFAAFLNPVYHFSESYL